MNMQNKYNVALYLRLSRDDNDGNSESMSISNQRALLKDYVQERGWSISDIYIDDGYSGTNFNRPDFQRMIADINEGRINCVVTKDLSRFGRNYAQVGYYTEEFFLEKDVRFIAINDNVDTMRGDNDIAPFKNILNEMYAKDISRKIKSARKVNARQGKFMGSQVPYGYKRSPEDKHQLIIDEEVAPYVRMVFDMVSKGYSKREITEKLNVEKVPSPGAYYYIREGKTPSKPLSTLTWNSCTITAMVSNPVYKGDMVQGKRKVVSFKTKRRAVVPQEDWIIVEDTHEGIVSKELWATAQTSKRKYSTRVVKDRKENLFGGIIRCADCGSAMSFSTQFQNGKTDYYYKCARYNTHGKEACSSHRIPAKLLNEIVLKDIQKNARLLTADRAKLEEKLFLLRSNVERDNSSSQKKSLGKKEHRIIEIGVLIKKLFEEKVSGNLPEDVYLEMLTQYKEEKEQLTKEIETLKVDLEKTQNVIADITAWAKSIADAIEIKELDRDTLLTLIDYIEVMESVRVDSQRQYRIAIHYRFVGNLEGLHSAA